MWGWVTTPLELTSFLLSVITVALNIRQIHWGWMFSILSSLLYCAVFFDARLYGDSGLQVVFVLVSIWGWAQWWRHGDVSPPLVVTRLDRFGRIFSVLASLLIFAALYFFLKSATDTDVPLADSFLTAGSLAGQILLSRKKLENWYVWIVVDVLYVALYVYKNLMLTAVLYAIFVVMAIIGARTWRALCPK